MVRETITPLPLEISNSILRVLPHTPYRNAGVLIALALLLLHSPLRAQPCLDYGQFIQWVHSYEADQQLYAIAVDGDYAYVGKRWMGLEIFDISDPRAMYSVGTLTGHSWSRDVAVAQPYAYVAYASSEFRGLQIVDVGDPTSPSVVTEIATGGNANQVVLRGDFAYVAAADSGLRIIDISNPQVPVLAGTLDTPGVAWGVDLGDSIACIASADSGLHVVDIVDPTNPQLLGSVDTPGMAWGAAVSGTYVYVADRMGGLHVVDIANPMAPVIIHTDPTVDPNRVKVVGNLLYVQEFDHLTIMEVTAPESLQRIGWTPGLPFAVTGFALSGTLAYLTIDVGYIHVLDLAAPESPLPLGGVDTPGYAADVTVSEQYAYVADNSTGVPVIDVSNPNSPQVVQTVGVTANARGVVASGQNVFVWDDVGLSVVDASDPLTAHVVGFVAIPSTFVSGDFAVSGNYAYVPGYDDSLFVVDVSNPQMPKIDHTLDLPQGCRAIALDGENAALIDQSGHSFSWLDLSTPGQPAVVGSIALPDQSTAVTVVGHYAYVAMRRGVLVIDGLQPTAPVIVGSAALSYSVTEVLVHGNHAYASAWSSGVFVIDITDPATPVPLGYVQTRNAQAVAISGDQVVVADGNAGIQLLSRQCTDAVSPAPELPTPRSTRLLQPFPNPFNPQTTISFTLHKRQLITLSVFDVAGREIKVLARGDEAAGQHDVLWTGRDSRERQVPSGVYFIGLRTSQGLHTRKVVLTK